MKRILFDIKQIGTVPPPYGGISVYIKRLISNLTKDGYKVGGYYVPDIVNKEFNSSPLFEKWTWFETYKYPIKIWKFLNTARKYKIFHSHCSLEMMSYLWTVKFLFSKHIIITVHNSMVCNYYKKTNFINRFFINRMLQTDKVTWIAVSKEGKEQLESLPVKSKSPIIVIPAYIPIEQKEHLPLSDSMQSYIDSHNRIISFYGHSFMLNGGEDVYGFESALRMYAEICRQKENIGMIFCIAEIREKEKIEALHRIAVELSINDKIYWQIGAISNIKSLWRQTHIYIRPTSTDGDSVAIREVLDEGAIVIASDVCTRPIGVIVYKYNDLNDFIKKVKENLNTPKNEVHYNYESYNKMKAIYDRILN